MNMSPCTLFNEPKKEPSLLRISTWSVLGKQNVQAKKVYCFETIPRNRDFRAAFEFQRSSHENNIAAKYGEVKKYNQGDRPRQYAGIAVNCI